MPGRSPVALCGVVLALGLAAGFGKAQAPGPVGDDAPRWPDHPPAEPLKLAPPVPGHTLERAGHPERVSCLAAPSDTGSYVGYYVGGGAPCCGDRRHPGDGTWGWDYQGCLFLRRVALDWWHGRCSQGGLGHYRTVFPPNPHSPGTP